MYQKERHVGMLLAAWLLSIIVPCVALAQEAPALRIGTIVSLTGDAAKNGRNWLEGAELAVDDLRRDGIGCELLVEDDGTKPVKVASAFTKLVTVDKVQAIVGGTWDFLAEAAFPFAARYKIPFVTPTNPVEVLSSAALANPHVFTNGLSLSAEKTAIAAFMQSKQVRTLGLVYINVPYGTLHAQMLRSLARQTGVSVLVDHEVTYEGFHETIQSAASRVRASNPELIFAVLNYEGIDLLLRELERIKSRPLVMMTHTLKEAFDFARAPARYERAFGVLQRYSDPGFEQRFVARFGRQPYGYAGPGYDAVQFLARALAAGVFSKPAAAAFHYPGVTGLHVYPAPTHELVKTSASVMIVKGDRLEEAAAQ